MFSSSILNFKIMLFAFIDDQTTSASLQFHDIKYETGSQRPAKKAKVYNGTAYQYERAVQPTSAVFTTDFIVKMEHERRIRIISRLFPEKKRSVLETILRECRGNLLEALECLISSNERLRTMPPLINTSSQMRLPFTTFSSSPNFRFPYFTL